MSEGVERFGGAGVLVGAADAGIVSMPAAAGFGPFWAQDVPKVGTVEGTLEARRVAVTPQGGGAAGREAWRPMVCAYDWPCEQALSVMWCESTGNPRAESGGNIGLFQINRIHSGMVGGDASRLYDPATNVRIAHEIWVGSGWRPWGCRP